MCQFLPADTRECVTPPRPGDITSTGKSRVCSVLFWYVKFILCSVQYSLQCTGCSVQYSLQCTGCSVQYSTDNVVQCLHPVPRPPLANWNAFFSQPCPLHTLHCTALHCTALHVTALMYCFIMYYTALHYITFHWTTWCAFQHPSWAWTAAGGNHFSSWGYTVQYVVIVNWVLGYPGACVERRGPCLPLQASQIRWIISFLEKLKFKTFNWHSSTNIFILTPTYLGSPILFWSQTTGTRVGNWGINLTL